MACLASWAAYPAFERDRDSRRGGCLAGLCATVVAVGLALALLAPSAGAFTLQVTGPAAAPGMVFNAQMSVGSVCLPVTNPAGGQSILYGQRFTDGPVSAATPAIVLAHGITSSTRTGTSPRPGR